MGLSGLLRGLESPAGSYYKLLQYARVCMVWWVWVRERETELIHLTLRGNRF